MLKKLVESGILAVGLLIFIITLYDVRIDLKGTCLIFNFAISILNIVFATCGIYIIANGFYAKIDKRANAMAICYMLTSIFIVLNIIESIDNNSYMTVGISMSPVGIRKNLLDSIFLIICTCFISEKGQIKKKVYTFIITCFSIFLILGYVHLPYDINMDKQYYNQIKGISGVLIIIMSVCGVIITKNRYREIQYKEEKILYILYLNRVIDGFLMIYINSYTIELDILHNLLDSLLYMGVLSYIYETTLEGDWRTVKLDVNSNEREINRRVLEKHILISAAKNVDYRITNMNLDIDELASKITQRDLDIELGYIYKIKKNCNRLTKLSRNIVLLNKYDKGREKCKFIRVDLQRLIREIVSYVNPYLESKNLTIQIVTMQNKIICDVDIECIERIILNLISNSIKYSNYGGCISISVWSKKKHVYMVIQDKGVGIPEDLIKIVFDRYIRVDSELVRDQEGSGLGLSIVKSLVDLHSGKIEIRSKKNKGTDIGIILPMYQKNSYKKEVKELDREEIHKKVDIEFSDIERRSWI